MFVFKIMLSQVLWTYEFLLPTLPSPYLKYAWTHLNDCFVGYSTGVEIDASLSGAASLEKECAEVECPRKR